MAQMLITFQTKNSSSNNNKSLPEIFHLLSLRCTVSLATSPQCTRNFTFPVGLDPSFALAANLALATPVASAVAACQPLDDARQLPGLTSLWLAETLTLRVLEFQDHGPLVQQEHEAVMSETD